jgi:hypothetical protein
MTLRIDRYVTGNQLVVHLTGNMRVEHLDELKAEIAAAAGEDVALDVGELSLVCVEGIRYLNACQDTGIPIINPSPYISEWMTLERNARPPRA